MIELRCIGPRYRLREDGTWRAIEVGSRLEAGDFSSADPTEIARRWFFDRELQLDGKTWKVNPSACGAGEQSANLECRVLRKQAPPTPRVEALRQCIAAGDPELTNCLTVTVDGDYVLRPVPPFDPRAANPTVVMRHEPYLGDLFVGEDAAANDDFIEQEHAATLEHWLLHLRSGDLGIYVDMPSERTVGELEAEIDALRAGWAAQY